MEKQYYRLHTIKETIEEFTIILTQKLHEKYDFGHYSIVIMNKNGDIINVTSSTCSPPNKKTKKDLREEFKYWYKEYNEQYI